MSTRRYAVIGDPISHSLSPLMQRGWIEDHGLDASYEAVLLRSDDPVSAIRGLTQFSGLNVTAPHKRAAAEAADRSESEVANTLRREADGSLSAFSTDGPGFLASLQEAAPGWRARTGNVLLIGAGGAAQAIAEALDSAFDLRILNRTFSRAAELAERTPRAEPARWEAMDACFAAADLIVNTTTMSDESMDWPVSHCREGAVVADIVYTPLETALLKAARERGLIAIDGLGMLIHQGALAFEIWHGVKPDAAKARARLMRALST